MAVEIEVHPLAIGFLAEHPAQHADDLGALLVDGCRVEIVDGAIGFRAYGMGERAGIFGELARPQADDILDALHRARPHVGGEVLVTEDRETFLQAELEPVTAGDAVAGPVMEVFVRHDAFDGFEIRIGRRVFIRQHIGGVEDVQALVLHGAEIEIAHGHNVEHAEIIFPAIGLFIPFHRALEAVHRPGGAVGVALVDMDGQVNRLAAHRRELVGIDIIIASAQGEEIGRLLVRIIPDRKMAAIIHIACLAGRAVCQQDRIGFLVRCHAHSEAAHHVGAVRIEGDAAEADGFTLGAEAATGHVEARQRRVLGRGDLDLGDEGEIVRHICQRQPGGGQRDRIIRHRLAVNRNRFQIQRFAVQFEGRVRIAGPPDLQIRPHQGRIRMKVEPQIHLLDFEGIG